jgi:hypothetical protein
MGCGMPDGRLPAFVKGLPLTEAALAYAERLHAGQPRAVDGAPFILHPLEVASLLYYAGATDSVVAAGVLHDVIEDTAAEASDLQGRFGRRVTELVVAVSEDGSIADFAFARRPCGPRSRPPVTPPCCCSRPTRSRTFVRSGSPSTAAPNVRRRRHRRRRSGLTTAASNCSRNSRPTPRSYTAYVTSSTGSIPR